MEIAMDTGKVEDTIERLIKQWHAFFVDAEKAVRGNKSAARRSRVASIEMQKLMREYRAATLER